MVEADRFVIQQGRARVFLGGTFQESRTVMKEVIAHVGVRNFSHSVQLTWDLADIYGVHFRGGGWYLKLTLDEEMPEVAIISFHPLEAPLRTNGGEIKP
jgi:hypothetical protein